jgi:hypothetical protein
MKEELKKSLTDLIDETLLELEELKKSRFSAAEVDLKGPGADHLAGKPVNGKLGAEKAEDKKDEEEDEKDEDKAEKGEGVNSAADMGKGEGVNSAADVGKAEDKKDDDKDEDEKEPHKDDSKHEEKEKDIAKKLLDMHKGEMKKSLEEADSLMKSYVDQKVNALESKLATILETVTKLADAPVPAKGIDYKGATPLLKSADDSEPLSKSEVASKLFDLKKSGSRVDSNDIAMAEMGHDLDKIVSKYGIK